MKKWVVVGVVAVAVVALAIIGAVTGGAPEEKPPERSAELVEKYAYYVESHDVLMREMGLAPKQADEVFTALLSCGLDKKVTYAFDKTEYYEVWWGLKNVRVMLNDDGTVAQINNGQDILYPEHLKTVEETPDEADVEKEIEALEADNRQDIAIEDPTPPADLEGAVDFAIERAEANKTSVSIVDGDTGVYIDIRLEGMDNLTTGWIRRVMLIQADKILESLQPRDDFASIGMFWTFPLVDVYGNVKEDTVMKVYFEKETLDKINFESFDNSNIPNIADDYFEHAALSD